MVNAFNPLEATDLSKARKTITKNAYKRSDKVAFAWYFIDLMLYLLPLYGVFAVHNNWLKLLFGLLTGIAVSNLFVWAHDAAHGSLIKNKLLEEILGTIFMLPSFNIFKLWCYGHNKVHHGFTAFTPIDWIWRPLTLSEYEALSRGQRFIYRLERNMYTCALHYLLKIWWSKMLFFKPTNLKSSELTFLWLNKMAVLVFALLLTGVTYYFAGIIGVIAAVILPFIIFNYFIAFYIYLHHTHPDIPFFDERKDWNHAIGMLQSTTVIRCHWLVELLNHNILIHVPHHIDVRIPFYNLKSAYADIKINYGDYINEYQFSWRAVANIFQQCKLYDYRTKIWYSFKQAKNTSSASLPDSVIC